VCFFGLGTLRMVGLLNRVHPPVRFGEQCFHVVAVFWTEGRSHAQADHVFSAGVPSRLTAASFKRTVFSSTASAVSPGAVITNSSPPMRAT